MLARANSSPIHSIENHQGHMRRHVYQAIVCGPCLGTKKKAKKGGEAKQHPDVSEVSGVTRHFMMKRQEV